LKGVETWSFLSKPDSALKSDLRIMYESDGASWPSPSTTRARFAEKFSPDADGADNLFAAVPPTGSTMLKWPTGFLIVTRRPCTRRLSAPVPDCSVKTFSTTRTETSARALSRMSSCCSRLPHMASQLRSCRFSASSLFDACRVTVFGKPICTWTSTGSESAMPGFVATIRTFVSPCFLMVITPLFAAGSAEVGVPRLEWSVTVM